MQYSSNPNTYDKFLASPPPTAPPEFDQPVVTGIPVSSTHQFHTEQYSQPAPHIQQRTEVPWSSGLCDCCSDPGNCCMTCCCPCITFGQVSEIVDKGSSTCGPNGAIYFLIASLTCCACIYSCFYRSKMRQQYMLKESPCGDCLVHFCCEACALCQEYRELKSRGFDMSIGWDGNVERQNHGVMMGPMPPVPPVVEGGMSR